MNKINMNDLVSVCIRKDRNYEDQTSFRVDIHSFTEEYKGVMSEEVSEYMECITDLPQLKANAEKDIDSLNKQIDMLLKQRAEKEISIRFMGYSEEVIAKNKAVNEYVQRLRNENKMNVWVEKADGCTTLYSIENAVFSFDIILNESAPGPNGACRVSYRLNTNNKTLGGTKLQDVSRKLFKGKEKAIQYIEGRKEYFEKYFKEEYPVIPKENAGEAYFRGILLDGFSVEE